MSIDLNTLVLGERNYPGYIAIKGPCFIHMYDLKKMLVACIRAADVVLGCVSWGTDKEIFNSLAEKMAVSLIVQKQKYITEGDNFRSLYNKLPCFPGIEPVRCMGLIKEEGELLPPMMHHKFLIFGQQVMTGELGHIVPYAVWTGSLNLTGNGFRSLNDSLYIADTDAAYYYYEQFERIFILSESLDYKKNGVGGDMRAFPISTIKYGSSRFMPDQPNYIPVSAELLKKKKNQK